MFWQKKLYLTECFFPVGFVKCCIQNTMFQNTAFWKKKKSFCYWYCMCGCLFILDYIRVDVHYCYYLLQLATR